MAFAPETSCKSGHKHKLFMQANDRACGLACVSMVLLSRTKTAYAEADLFDANKREQATRREVVVSLLDRFGVAAEAKFVTGADDMKRIVRAVTPGAPVIASVGWENEGFGHWVVVEGRTTNGLGASSTYCICDPFYGFQRTSLTGGRVMLSLPKSGPSNYPGLLYTPCDNRAGGSGGAVRKGVFSGHFILVK